MKPIYRIEYQTPEGQLVMRNITSNPSTAMRSYMLYMHSPNPKHVIVLRDSTEITGQQLRDDARSWTTSPKKTGSPLSSSSPSQPCSAGGSGPSASSRK